MQPIIIVIRVVPVLVDGRARAAVQPERRIQGKIPLATVNYEMAI